MKKQIKNLTWIDFWKEAKCEPSGFEELLGNSHFYGVEPALVSVDEFLEHIETIKRILRIQPDDTVFEVGCGGGLILYPFYEDDHVVGGSELSPSYLEAAKNLMPEGRFEAGHAINIQKTPTYDYVLSCATANYFPDLSYFKSFIEVALQKADKAVYIAQLNDVEKQEPYYRINKESENLPAWKMFMEQYESDETKAHNDFFENADRLFFNREMFREYEKQHNVAVKILPQAVPNKAGAYRFDVALIKR